MVEREISVTGRVAARIQEGSIPELLAWDDVATFDGRRLRGIVSIVSAGFPCQPFSVAGKRKGTDDARWIWPDIARIIGEVAPEVVFLENVPGLLLDPDIDFDRWAMDEQPDDALGGMGTVLRDLAGLGFDAEWCCVSASDVGASHGRKRVFILAYRECTRRDGGTWAWILGNRSPLQTARFGDGNGRMADSEHTRPSSTGTATRCETAPDNAVRSDGPLGNPERTERWPSAIGSGCDRAGIDGEGKTASGAGNGKLVLADSASSGPSIRRNDSGIRECSTIERTSSELEHDSAGSGSIPRVGDFAPGPADPRWEDLLVSRPWLRPSWSQAEAESYFRNLVDGLAPLVAAERTGALRTLGDGVVPLQAALAFTVLIRRILCL